MNYKRKQVYNSNTITVKVCGKLILFGEHLVFYNNSVLGIPLPFYLEAIFCYEDIQKQKNNDMSKFQLISDYPIDSRFIDLIYRVCKQNNLYLPSSKVYIESTIPIGSGYGSSAALCVALAKGILHYNKNGNKHSKTLIDTNTKHTEIPKQDIWYFAHALEQFFHNPSSGIDTALCTYKQALFLHPYTVSTTREHDSLQKHSNKEAFNIPKFSIQSLKHISQRHCSLSIVSAVVSREIPAKELIKYVKEQLHSSSTLQILQQLHNTVLQQLTLYYTAHNREVLRESFNYRLFAHTVEALQQQLYNLGLCTPTMQKAMHIAMKAGSIATKLSGAGGGGAFVCFCKTKEEAQNVHKALQQYSAVQYLSIQML